MLPPKSTLLGRGDLIVIVELTVKIFYTGNTSLMMKHRYRHILVEYKYTQRLIFKFFRLTLTNPLSFMEIFTSFVGRQMQKFFPPQKYKSVVIFPIFMKQQCRWVTWFYGHFSQIILFTERYWTKTLEDPALHMFVISHSVDLMRVLNTFHHLSSYDVFLDDASDLPNFYVSYLQFVDNTNI